MASAVSVSGGRFLSFFLFCFFFEDQLFTQHHNVAAQNLHGHENRASFPSTVTSHQPDPPVCLEMHEVTEVPAAAPTPARGGGQTEKMLHTAAFYLNPLPHLQICALFANNMLNIQEVL